jgi:hypothetical protein
MLAANMVITDNEGFCQLSNAHDRVFKSGCVLKSSGLEESVEKACSPSTIMTFVGVSFNSVELTLSVTSARVSEIFSDCDLVEKNKKTGTVNFKKITFYFGLYATRTDAGTW